MKRFQIGLRLSLLIMALCAVCCAYVRARLDLYHADVVRSQINFNVEDQLRDAERNYRHCLEQLAETRRAGPANRPFYKEEIAYLAGHLNESAGKITKLKKQIEDLEP